MKPKTLGKKLKNAKKRCKTRLKDIVELHEKLHRSEEISDKMTARCWDLVEAIKEVTGPSEWPFHRMSPAGEIADYLKLWSASRTTIHEGVEKVSRLLEEKLKALESGQESPLVQARLSRDEQLEARKSVRRDIVAISATIDRGLLRITFGNLDIISLPVSLIKPSGLPGAPAPDFTKLSIKDSGRTLAFGEYEVAASDLVKWFKDSARTPVAQTGTVP
jgi:hypothetical protein